MNKARLLLVLALLVGCGTWAEAASDDARSGGRVPAFADGERVAFLGDSITRAGGWHALVALFHETRFPARKVEWLNAGVSGDTAEAALRRLHWDVLDRRPDRVVVMFGVNDVGVTLYDGENGPEKIAAREARLVAYERAMRALVAALREAGVGIVLCSPPPYEERGNFPPDKVARLGAADAVARCAEIVRRIGAEAGLPVVDFHEPMRRMAADFQKTNPAFSLFGDRVHPTPAGHLVMAFHFLKAMEVPAVVAEVDTAHTRFSLPGDALPMAFDDEQRRALPLVPWQEELNAEIVRVVGLPEGYHEVRVDGESVGVWWHTELAAGVNLASLASTPRLRLAQEMRRWHAERHAARAIGPRVLAAIRHQVLEPAGVDAADAEAVARALEGRPEAAQQARFAKEVETTARRAAEADRKLAELKKRIAPACVEVRPLADPLDAAKRRADFSARRSAAALDALAREFFALIDFDATDDLAEIKRRLEAGDSAGALAAWRDRFLAKLADADARGWDAFVPAGALSTPEARRGEVLARAAELHAGKIVPSRPPMPPGEVWLPPGPPSTNGATNPWSPALFRPLAEAHAIDGDARHLSRYFEYMDDWAMHETCDEALEGTDISDTASKGASLVADAHAVWRAIAASPAGPGAVPADTLARVQLRLVRLYLAPGLVYHASNPQNWTPGGTAALMSAALLFDEFRFAPRLFDLARRRHENYGVIQFFPDGSETENALWYNAHYHEGASRALALAEALAALPSERRPAWADAINTPEWKAEQTEKLIARARFFVRMLAPPGVYPIGNRSDLRKLPDWISRGLVEFAGAAGAHDVAATLATYAGGSGRARQLDAFPWRGAFLLREGREGAQGHAHFFCSPLPGGGHALRALKNNNSLGLAVAGRDLLVGGSVGPYSYERTPLRVDGREQFFNAGLGNPGGEKNHKGFGVAYVDAPPPAWRLHDGEDFALVEGEYAGPYGDFVDDHHDDKNYAPGFLARRAADVLTGVTHRRQVFRIKAAGIWVVVDRVSADRLRAFSLDWRFPVRAEAPTGEGRRPLPYPHPLASAEDVTASSDTGIVKMDTPDAAGVTLRHFGPALEFAREREDGSQLARDFTLRYKLYDQLKVSGTWRGSGGDELMVALVMPRAPGDPEPVIDVRPVGDGRATVGFVARTPAGMPVGFLAAWTGAARLGVAGEDAESEALLVAGKARLVLGERRADGLVGDRVRGWTGGEETPIFTPVAPVRFSPARDVLLAGETVELTSDTPDVELRYTLDGGEPGPLSPRYEGPIVIERSTRLRARAYRIGAGAETAEAATDFSRVSPVSSAFFRVEPMIVAPRPEAARSRPGLAVRRWEGGWRDLLLFPERARETERAVSPALFDRVTPRADAAFAVEYMGGFVAHADGVYTLHAPAEWVSSAQEAGYHLHVELAGRAWYPATTRHAYGTWSVALTKGVHPLRVYYADYRRDAVARQNHPGLRLNTVWDGLVPSLRVSGPGLAAGPINASQVVQP